MSKPHRIDKNSLKRLVEARVYDKIASAEGKKRTATTLISFLYESEPFVFYAAEALGIICGVIEREGEAEFVRKILRRLFWHLRDESGAYCRGAPLAIGEIGRNAPVAFKGFKNILLSLLRNEEVELKYVIYGIGRDAENMRDAHPDPVGELMPFLEHWNVVIRGYTLITLCALKASIPGDKIEIGNDEEFEMYFEGEIVKLRFSDLIDRFSGCLGGN
jgi:hypothetical protein